MIINNKSSYYFTYSVIYGKNFISNLKSSMSTKKDVKKIKNLLGKKKRQQQFFDMTWPADLWLFILDLLFQFILSNKLDN